MICQHRTQTLCGNASKYLVIRIEKCDGALGFWILIKACFRHANYLSVFSLLRDVSCRVHLIDDITQVISYDCQIVWVEFAPYPIIPRRLLPSTRLYALVISFGSKGDSNIPPYEVCRSQRIASINFFMLASSPLFLFFTLDVGLQARSQYTEGPATGHFDTGFPWLPCA